MHSLTLGELVLPFNFVDSIKICNCNNTTGYRTRFSFNGKAIETNSADVRLRGNRLKSTNHGAIKNKNPNRYRTKNNVPCNAFLSQVKRLYIHNQNERYLITYLIAHQTRGLLNY